MRWRAFSLVAIPAVLAGCASPPPSGVADVQKLVANRTGHSVQWDRREANVDDLVRSKTAGELTVDDAVQIALLNNHGLRATLQDLGIARADLMQAGLIRNPVLDVSARFPDRSPKGPNVEISISQDVLDLLMIPAKKRLAGVQFEAAKSRVAAAVIDLVADTRAAFYSAQAAAQLVEMRQSIVDATSASADAAKRLNDAGNINDLDLATQQAMDAQTRLDLAAAEADLLDARERLTTLMGLWGERIDYRLASRLPDPPAVEVEPRGLESRAISQRLDLAAQRQAVEAAAQSLGLSRQFRFLSSLDVGVDTERDPGGQRVTGPTFSVPIPLFDQGQAALAGSQSRLQQAREQYLALAVQIRSQVRTARNRMYAARQRVEYYHDVLLPLRQRVVDQMMLHYNGMSASIFQLLQSRQSQIDAGRGYVEALRDYWLARSELERAVGGKLPH